MLLWAGGLLRERGVEGGGRHLCLERCRLAPSLHLVTWGCDCCGRDWRLRMEIAEDESGGGLKPPIGQPALERAQLPVRKAPWIGALQSSKEVDSGLIGIGVKPAAHFRPDFLEWIYAASPGSARARFSRMGRADLAGFPREREAGEELGQVRVADRRRMHALPFGQRGQMMLHGTNLIEQAQGIEAVGEILEPRLDHGCDPLRRHQACCRRRRSKV